MRFFTFTLGTCLFRSSPEISCKFPELDCVGGTWKWGQMCGVGTFREPVGNMQPRQECLGLGRFVLGCAVVTTSKQKLLYLFISFLMCFTVDEEDEYECVTVLNSHTQDVKHAVWHPTKEVSLSPVIASIISQLVTPFKSSLSHAPCGYTAPGLSQLRQQHLRLQGRGWWLGVQGHLKGTHIHGLEFDFWCSWGADGLLQRRPHREDLERVRGWKCTGWVVGRQHWQNQVF